MSPRPRKVSDDEVFMAVHRLMMRVKPPGVTLAAVGEEAGLTAGALVQRFGSKRDLMRAFNARFAEGTDEMFAQHRAAAASPLAALRSFAEGFAMMGASPETLAHHLAYLQQDLSDPETYERVRAHTVQARQAIGRWLDEAVAGGELVRGTDTHALARAIHTTVTGSMMSYAFFREGTPREWIAADLALVLGPHLARQRRA